MLRFWIVRLEVFGLDVFLHLVFPALLSVLEEILVNQSDDARVTSPRKNLLFWLEVEEGFSRFYHELLHNRLCLFDLHALTCTNDANSLKETFLVAKIFCLIELVVVFVALNFQFFASVFC